MQVVQVYLQPFWHNSLVKYAPQLKIAKKTLRSLIVQGSRSFKVIDVDTIYSKARH